MRLVLASGARFSAVDEHLTRCGLTITRHVPQVFPARNEPHQAVWATPDGVEVATFTYWVNPDRRALDFEGPEATALARAARLALGEVRFEDMREALLADDDDAAFAAAFMIAISRHPDAADLLCDAVRGRDEHVATGCLRALEICGTSEVVERLRVLQRDTALAGVVRLLAGEVSNALAGAPKFH